MHVWLEYRMQKSVVPSVRATANVKDTRTNEQTVLDLEAPLTPESVFNLLTQ